MQKGIGREVHQGCIDAGAPHDILTLIRADDTFATSGSDLTLGARV
jgi:hypothetical protein